MLFSIIVAEVLSIFIDVNTNIIGIQIGDHEMVVVDFADDTTIFLRNFSFLTKIELVLELCDTTQKMKFSIKDFFSKYDQIRRKLRIWSHLLKISLMENFTFCAVGHVYVVFTSSSPPNISFDRNNKCFIKLSA